MEPPGIAGLCDVSPEFPVSCSQCSEYKIGIYENSVFDFVYGNFIWPHFYD